MSSSPAIPAATIVIVRDREAAPPLLLMVERAASMAFAPGMMVFPGGRVDDADRAFGLHLGHPLGDKIVAAIRETLEETAIPVALAPLPTPVEAAQMQRALLQGTSLADVLASAHMTLDPSALTHFTRWRPPGDLHRRFDTWFFLAQAPPGDWLPLVGEEENKSAEWISAREALDRDSTGRARLIFPTRRNLERLALRDSYSAMLADAAAHRPALISPEIEDRDGERWLTIPEGLGYPITAERFTNVKRG